MWNKLFNRFAQDVGIDLGTANTLVYVRDRGIVINEPSVVAINTKTNQVIAVGEQARRMVGKTPGHIIATKPLVDGVISDFEVTERMLRYFFTQIQKESFGLAPRPRVVIGIPLGVTEVERKAVEDAALHAGAREVYLIEEPMAAAIGARMPIQEASGNMIVDIGGGTTEIAVISLGGVVAWKALRLGGVKMDQDIMQYARDHFNLLMGEKTAEDIKVKIGSAWDDGQVQETRARGRDLISGLPREVIINSTQVREALKRSLTSIIENIKATIENTPPELVADIYERGIVLTGGGAMLKGIDLAISQETKIPIHITDDPLTSVARGGGIVLEDLNLMKSVLVLSSEEKPYSL
jgi:rod shape-determining protein MreB